MKPLLILGTGLAGYTLAREFRKLDQTRPLVLVMAVPMPNRTCPMRWPTLARPRPWCSPMPPAWQRNCRPGC